MSAVKKLSLGFFVCFLVGILILLGLVIYTLQGLPQLNSLASYQPALVTQVRTQDGKVIGEFYTERRYLISKKDMPKLIIQAFISAEDDRFFDHRGIDFPGILRAALANIKAGRVVQGGSTITQQVAKSILQSTERSFKRKFKEAILASQMESNLSKDEILYLYLNQIYLGHGAYGVEAASRSYFRKPASDLTIAEAALLAGLAQAPSRYSPLKNPVDSRKRQLYVLKRMIETKQISLEQFQAAVNTNIKLFLEIDLNNKIAPYYVEYVRQRILEDYGSDELYQGGMQVTVGADYELSLAAQDAVRDNLHEITKRRGYRGPLKSLKKDQTAIVEELKRIRLISFRDAFEFRYLPLDTSLNLKGAPWQEYTFNVAMDEGLFDEERDLIRLGKYYDAIVVRFDKKKETAFLLIGGVQAKVGIANMRWAKRVKEGEINNGQVITRVSEAFKKGDVIRVRILQIPKVVDENLAKEKTEEVKIKEMVSVSLEQRPIAQSALFSMEANTGRVVAMVGGYSFQESEYNRVLQGARQPGSAFKPIIYAAALDKGFNPASIIVDSPLVFDNQGKEDLKWIPENHGERYYGDTTLRMALVKSRNVPTVKLLQEIQIPYLIDYAQNLGIHQGLNADLSIALGSNGISLVDLTKTYSLFPRNGLRIEPVYIFEIVNRDGETLYKHTKEDLEGRIAEKWLRIREEQDGPKEPDLEFEDGVDDVTFSDEEEAKKLDEKVNLEQKQAEEKRRTEIGLKPDPEKGPEVAAATDDSLTEAENLSAH